MSAIAWQPHTGPQTEALSRSEDEILYGGARGGGKTDAGLAWLLRNVDNSKYRFLVIRRNAEDLSDWLDRAKAFYAPLRAEVVGRPAVIKFPTGAMGRIGHLKDENAYDHYQGHEYHKVLIEELTQIPKEDRYLKLLSSCRSTVPGLSPQAFLTTNPGGPGHVWVKNRFVSHRPYRPYKDPKSGRLRIYIPAKLSDNPTLMESDPSYEAFLKSLPEQTRKAWLDGNWDVFEGQFFSSWNSEIHICEPFKIPKEWARYIGVDYGYAAPSAVVWIAFSPDGRAYLYRELYRTGLTFEQLRDEIIERSAGEKIDQAFVDPALKAKTQGTGIVGLEVLNSEQDKIQFWPADNNRPNGWARVREYLRIREDSAAQPYTWLQIFDTCEQTIKTLPELVHDSVKVEDLDSDGDDHIADALRYLVMGRPTPHEVPKENKYAKMKPTDAMFWKNFHRVKEQSMNQYEGDEQWL